MSDTPIPSDAPGDPPEPAEDERPKPAGVQDERRPKSVRADAEERSRPMSVRQSLTDSSSGAAADESSRPTPVRDTMRGEPDEEPVEAPTVTFHRGEEEWVARVVGRNMSGRPPDQGRAPLLLLAFARADAPDKPLLEALRVGRVLDQLSEEQLVESLNRARPYRGQSWDREELFADTRRDRGR